LPNPRRAVRSRSTTLRRSASCRCWRSVVDREQDAAPLRPAEGVGLHGVGQLGDELAEERREDDAVARAVAGRRFEEDGPRAIAGDIGEPEIEGGSGLGEAAVLEARERGLDVRQMPVRELPIARPEARHPRNLWVRPPDAVGPLAVNRTPHGRDRGVAIEQPPAQHRQRTVLWRGGVEMIEHRRRQRSDRLAGRPCAKETGGEMIGVAPGVRAAPDHQQRIDAGTVGPPRREAHDILAVKARA
jgi:hypothetical protein